MKQMTTQAQRSANGGSVRCNYCGWTVWGFLEAKKHIQRRHHGNVNYYSFFWEGPYNCYTDRFGRRV